MATRADIAIYGGAAGGGKTFALLLEPMRHLNNRNFRAAIFRRTHTQVMQPGGLWEESEKLYPSVGARANLQDHAWKFPSGMSVSFHYLATAADKYKYQGAQIPLIGFDELTHFSEDQFFYMLSRVRSTSGVPGYIRGTCNPDPDSWVARFIGWWIGEDGYPIAERSGVLRYFIRQGDDLVWSDSAEELKLQYGEDARPRSVTFIPAGLADNKILMEKDPDYKANLLALPTVEREQLLGGNWKIKPAAGLYFKGSQFGYCEPHQVPPLVKKVRYWDRAATEPTAQNPDPDYTVGVLMGKAEGLAHWYVLDVERFREGPAGVLRRIRATAKRDGPGVTVALEQDPGQAGKVEAQYLAGQLSDVGRVKLVTASKAKAVRATPFSSQVQAGNVTIVRAPWNDAYIRELEAFSGDGSGKDDQVDGSSGAFNELESKQKKAMVGRA